MEREFKNERAGRGRGWTGFVGKRFLPFFPPPPALLLAPFFELSLTLVPCSLLRNFEPDIEPGIEQDAMRKLLLNKQETE